MTRWFIAAASLGAHVEVVRAIERTSPNGVLVFDGNDRPITTITVALPTNR